MCVHDAYMSCVGTTRAPSTQCGFTLVLLVALLGQLLAQVVALPYRIVWHDPIAGVHLAHTHLAEVHAAREGLKNSSPVDGR